MQKLDKIKTESAQKWKKFTSEMDAAADEFEKAFERAKSHFKE
jgi:phage-related minor tail protein